jgi:uncharacterized delta-60 repeat protein
MIGVAALAAGSAQATQSPLDTSFGSGGTVTTSLSSGADNASAVAVQPDGKILVVGSGGAPHACCANFGLVRYNVDGSLDTSFGSGGIVTTNANGADGEGRAVALQPDGKIIVGGSGFSGNTRDFALARFDANGSIDTSFGTNGVVTTDILGGADTVTGLALQPDGKIVAAGTAETGSTSDFALVRYNADGSIDSTFGTNGKVTTSLGSGDSVASALVRQPDGKLVVAGYTGSDANTEIALARYDANGSLDPSFGSGGEVTTSNGSASVANALALQADGKIVAAGMADSANALVRYNTDGTLDTSFGDGGFAEGGAADTVYALAVQADGRILAAGQAVSGGHNVFALTRYAADGSPDLTFGTDDKGGTTAAFGSGDANADAMALQPDGRIVVAGTADTVPTDPSTYDFAAARFFGSTIAVNVAGSGRGTVISSPAGIHCSQSCAAPFAPGTVTLSASAAAGSAFTGWSGDCSGKTTCSVTVSTDRAVTATFAVLCVVPKLKGRTLLGAEKAIRRARCSVGKVSSVYSAGAARGRVISQKPRPGTRLARNSKVSLTVSRGRRKT